MYALGANGSTDTMMTYLDWIPAINAAMIAEVARSLQTEGLWAMAFGPAQGIPYKIYATLAGVQGISFFQFVLVSIPARLIRFLLTMVIAWAAGKYLLVRCSARVKYGLWVATWVIVYVIYFANHPF
jgi:membrane protein YqaA with SNARE-associated domain